MKYIRLIPFLLLILPLSLVAQQSDSSKLRLEGGLTVTHFQQQVKEMVGGATGERLVNEFQIGALVSGAYQLTEYLYGASTFALILGLARQRNLSDLIALVERK